MDDINPGDKPKSVFTVVNANGAKVLVTAHNWWVGEGSNVLSFTDYVKNGEAAYDYSQENVRAFGNGAWLEVYKE